MSLLALVLTIVHYSKAVNLITSFPNNLYVSKDDKVGFLLAKFVNGTRVQREVFPEPIISSPKDDIFVKNQVEWKYCRNTRVARPLETISICEKPNEAKAFVKVKQFKSNQLLNEEYSFEIPNGVICKDTFYLQRRFFAVCTSKNAQSNHDLKFYTFVLFPGDVATKK